MVVPPGALRPPSAVRTRFAARRARLSALGWKRPVVWTSQGWLDIPAQHLLRGERRHPGDPHVRAPKQPATLDLARERELLEIVGAVGRRGSGGRCRPRNRGHIVALLDPRNNARELVAGRLRERNARPQVRRQVHWPLLGIHGPAPRADVAACHAVHDVVGEMHDVVPARQLPLAEGRRRLLQLHPGPMRGSPMQLLSEQRTAHPDVRILRLVDLVMVTGDPQVTRRWEGASAHRARDHRRARGPHVRRCATGRRRVHGAGDRLAPPPPAGSSAGRPARGRADKRPAAPRSRPSGARDGGFVGSSSAQARRAARAQASEPNHTRAPRAALPAMG